MKMRKKAAFLLAGIAMAGLIGCGNVKQPEKSTSVEGLRELGKITVVSREEGSGTRGTFAQLLDFQSKEEGRADLTTEDAIITESSEGVIDLVESDSAGIGYLSMGTRNLDKVKVLSVNGISADVNDSKYPLTRGFYLAYSGKLSELEQDFMIYIHGAGQEIVGKSYAQIAKSSTFLSNQAKGTIVIGGSSSVYPLIKELAENYMKINPNAEITVKQSDSTDGLTGAMNGTYDLGMSSRELKDYEKELLDY
ncbi:MAG: substrate-binding domain-containing protein [Lachnospiraceae bacterium]|nr:substrate-binding domain-containing protein [Lachnospiraceae bacterium]